MRAKAKKEEKFKKRLAKVLSDENLRFQHQLIRQVCNEMNVSLEDCAAALVFLSQPNLYTAEKHNGHAGDKDVSQIEIPLPSFKQKSVAYRLEIGREHNVQIEQLKTLLVEEAGVDVRRIDKIDIRDKFTIIDLPEGMPADIFQHLSELEVHDRKLNLKRLKQHRKFRRFRKSAS